MRAIDSTGCIRWCSQRGIDSGNKRHLRIIGASGHANTIVLPKSGLEVIGLSNVLSTYLSGGQHPSSLLWLIERGMWSDEYEVVGARMWEKLAQGYGVGDASGMPPPALLFDADETEDERAFLVTAMLFQWDAAIVPDHGRYIVQISHDGYVHLLARDAATDGQLAAIAAQWGAPTISKPPVGGDQA